LGIRAEHRALGEDAGFAVCVNTTATAAVPAGQANDEQ
jgi:hypothetical protein